MNAMDIRDEIINQARALEGMAYRLDPPPDGVNNIDCSLFVLKVLSAAGIPLPPGVRTAEQIRQACVPVGWADVLPGDLLFFEHTYDVSEAAGPDGNVASHIGISLGAGTRRMWDANEAHGVGETFIGTDYWQGHLFEARRPPGLADAAGNMPENILGGIDVSSHQGAVDWQAVAASGIGFAFTKATGGTWYTNPTFAQNWLGIEAAGLVRGAYHYAFETSGQPFPGDGPEAEADYFLKALERAGGAKPGDLLALDIEDGNGKLGDWCLRWCRRVQAATGITPLVYTGTWFSVPHGFAETPALANYPLWLASYQDSMPAAPPPWSGVAVWQHTDALSVPGIAGGVDGNRFYGTPDELRALGAPAGGGGVATDEVAALKAENARLQEQLNGLVTAIAVIADDEGDKIAAAVQRIREIREQFVGAKPSA